MTDETSIEIDGLSYFVRDAGGTGEPVVLLHGMPDDGDVWESQFQALADAGYRAICPDLVGYGRSDAPEDLERYRTTRVVADVAALLDRLGIQRTHMVGHDWGAVVAWEFVLTHPERAASAVQLSVGHPVCWIGQTFDFDRMRWNWYLLLNLLEGAPDLYRADGGRLAKELLRTHPLKEKLLEQVVDPGRLEAALRWDRANPLPESAVMVAELDPSTLPPVAVPTLGIYSTGDEFLWEEQMTASAELMGAEWRYERIEGASHWLMLDAADRVDELILGWLGSHPIGAG